jgi:hypothetical protein
MRNLIAFVVVGAATALGNASANAQANSFNPYILKSVQMIYSARKGGGYASGEALTKDLSYGPTAQCCVNGVPHPKPPAGNPNDHKSMCVAGVHEVIVEAINMYAQDHKNDPASLAKLPSIDFWNKATALDIKPYLYLYTGFQSSGTADALTRFKLGVEVPFKQLTPGSFINLNRTNGSGHAVVFMSFIDQNGNEVPTYGSNVKGFRDFSVQGENSGDAGFTFRWAYFTPFCPATNPQRPRDCGVIMSDSQKLLNTGYMSDPSQWPALATIQQSLRNDLVSEISRISPNLFGQQNSAAQQNLNQLDTDLQQELPFSPDPKLSGVTTD